MIVVFGAGRQGECLVYSLKELGHDVFVADQTISDNVKGLYDNNTGWLDDCDFQHEQDIIECLHGPVELAISCLPYFLNERVAKVCIDNKIPYFDLGGHVGTSKAINDYAVEHDGQVFTDLGLAPGWVNIMAEECYRKLNQIDTVVTVRLNCGGLQDNAGNPPFNYKRTWSTEGLINEYKDDCWILDDGVREVVPGMSGILGVYGYEEFHTSGGIGKTLDLMEKRGVINCSYKTLRHPGHIKAVKTLIDAGYGVKDFDKLFEPSTKDFVVVTARAFGPNSRYELFYRIDCDKRFTAMQKCTAFPVASVANQFLLEKFYQSKAKDYSSSMLSNNSLDYSHVDFADFNIILSRLLDIKL
jgi:saccharopine dehydrogenase-like NADP-dependent oxidoreductase